MKKKQGLSKNQAPDPVLAELWKGRSLELLKALHIVTRDGQLNQDSRRKLKQVYHLVQLIEPTLRKLASEHESVSVVDVGAGKSYLGFILYDLVVRDLPNVRVVGVETRADLIARSQELAQAEKFERMEFWQGKAEEFPLETVAGSAVMVVALHACDTATDDAILMGLRLGAKAFALVPCCQAEVAQQLDELRDPSSRIASLWKAPIHRREFGSHVTNVIRVLAMQARGYRVAATELVGWEHSMKNELLLADRISEAYPPAQEKLDALLAEIPVRPKVLRGL